MSRPALLMPTPAGTGAARLLFALILAVAVSPRIRLAGGDTIADVRLQDLMLLPILVYIWLNPRTKGPSGLLMIWRVLLPLFLVLSACVLAGSIFINPEVSIVRRVAFYGRGIELFVIAACVGALWHRAGHRAPQSLLRAVQVGAFANFSWVLFQQVTGTVGTLVGTAVSDTVESYGPKLIGEPSAFGTGQFFATVAAFGIAQLRTRYGRTFPAAALVIMGSVGAYLANSRVSLLVILLTSVLMFIAGRGKSVLNPFTATLALLAGAIALLLIPRHLTGRLSFDGIRAGIGVRVDGIWDVSWNAAMQSPLTGLGPGGLLLPLPPEAHNIYIRAVDDYGIVVGPIFIGIFVVALVHAFRSSRADAGSNILGLTSTWAALVLLSVLVTGLVQDALTGVMSSHLAFIAIGAYAATYAQLPKGIPHESSADKAILERS